MKTNIKIIVIAFSVAVTLACRKERTCECTITEAISSTSGTASVSTTEKITTENQKAKEFREINKCYEHKATQTLTTGVTKTFDYKCHVK